MRTENKAEIIKVYRYEMPDGGGVNFTLDGVHRQSGIRFPEQNVVYGYTSEEGLNKYFMSRGGIPKECSMIVYEIPNTEVMVSESGQAIFDKSFVLKRLKSLKE